MTYNENYPPSHLPPKTDQGWVPPPFYEDHNHHSKELPTNYGTKTPQLVNNGIAIHHNQMYAPQMPQGAPFYYDPGNSNGMRSIPINVPPDLEILTQLDYLKIKQKIEAIEAFLNYESNNKYAIADREGRYLFSVKENTDCCTRMCCGARRPFDMKIRDLAGNEVIHLRRPLACQSCCFPCCFQKLEVYAPPGQLVGTVEQEWGLCFPNFVAKDAEGNVVLRIEGPLCTSSCLCTNVKFDIMTQDGSTQIGKISKKWTGCCKECITDADNYKFTFPIDLDVKMKVVMLGAVLLIDFMYFEDNNVSGGNKKSAQLAVLCIIFIFLFAVVVAGYFGL